MGDMNLGRRLLTVLVSSLALIACGDGGNDATSATITSTTTTTAATSTTVTSTTVMSPTASTSASTGSTGVASAPDGAAVITIERSRFSTDEIRVPVGTTVVWQNLDGYAHTVTSTDDAPVAFDSSGLAEGDRFEFTFDEPGTYAYFCQIHPTMRAVVIVE